MKPVVADAMAKKLLAAPAEAWPEGADLAGVEFELTGEVVLVWLHVGRPDALFRDHGGVVDALRKRLVVAVGDERLSLDVRAAAPLVKTGVSIPDFPDFPDPPDGGVRQPRR